VRNGSARTDALVDLLNFGSIQVWVIHVARPFTKKASIKTLIVFGALLCVARDAFAQPQTVRTEAIDEAICWVTYFTEDSLGALLFLVASIHALVNSVRGYYSSALMALTVVLGAWLIEPTAQFFFGYTPNCGQFNIPQR
jgi:hypothetical protein